MRRALQAEPDEKIVFTGLAWPSREACDAPHDQLMQGDPMHLPGGLAKPFNPKA